MSFALTPDDLRALNDDQKVAIMQSLLLAVLADGKTPTAETDKLDREFEAIEWGMAPAVLIEQMKAARGRILAMKDQTEAIELIQRIGTQLPDQAIREKVFRAMAAIMFADDQLIAAETNVLGKYATAFRLPHDRLEAIRADVTAAMPR